MARVGRVAGSRSRIRCRSPGPHTQQCERSSLLPSTSCLSSNDSSMHAFVCAVEVRIASNAYYPVLGIQRTRRAATRKPTGPQCRKRDDLRGNGAGSQSLVCGQVRQLLTVLKFRRVKPRPLASHRCTRTLLTLLTLTESTRTEPMALGVVKTNPVSSSCPRSESEELAASPPHQAAIQLPESVATSYTQLSRTLDRPTPRTWAGPARA
jgi:hypothetical protein